MFGMSPFLRFEVRFRSLGKPARRFRGQRDGAGKKVAGDRDDEVAAGDAVAVAVHEPARTCKAMFDPPGVVGLTCTTRVKSAWPGASRPSAAETAPVPPTAGVVEVEPAGTVRETNVVPAGMLVETFAACAASGPLFVNVIANVMFPSALTGFGVADTATARSALVGAGEPT